MVSQKPRENAARILLRHGEGRAFLEDVLDSELAEHRLGAADRSLVQELCYGVVRWQRTLDWLIDRQLRQGRVDALGRVLLRLGLYQLFWLDRIPPHAAVHETVETVRGLAAGAQAGFLNAVLRNYVRNADATRAQLLDLRTRDPSLGWSHPRWMVDRWKTVLPPAELQAFLAWNNEPAPVYARANTLKCELHRLIEAWRSEGVDYDFGRWDWVGENLMFLIRAHPPMERWKTLHRGWFYIQDPSTLLAIHLLDPQPGERILDLCAAPGGKTTFIAQRLDNDGRVVATESQPRRRERLRSNCERLGADVEVTAPDAPAAQGPFDAVLVDAPCSNTGVLRRRLDARWRLQPGDIHRHRKLQQELAAEGLRRLRSGGRLVYSTCSVEPEENAAPVDWLLARNPQVERIAERSLHPARDRVDGAYAVLLRKG